MCDGFSLCAGRWRHCQPDCRGRGKPGQGQCASVCLVVLMILLFHATCLAPVLLQIVSGLSCVFPSTIGVACVGQRDEHMVIVRSFVCVLVCWCVRVNICSLAMPVIEGMCDRGRM
jgi:hypothetical protein